MAQNKSDVNRVILWSIPRSCSTAVLKCLTYVPDTQVWYEPFLSSYYFSKFGQNRPSVTKFLCDVWGADIKDPSEDHTQAITGGYLAIDKTPNWVRQQLDSSPPGKKIIFSKDMAWGLENRYQDYLPDGFKHTFLIRHPYLVFDSFKRMQNGGVKDDKTNLSLEDLPKYVLPEGYSYKEQYNLYKYVKDHIDPNPVVIDTDDLLTDPSHILKAYCEAVGIPYTDTLLQWTPGRECLDEKWMVAKEHIFAHNLAGIHTQTFKSIEFGKVKARPHRSELDDDVLQYSEACLWCYEEMYSNRLI